MASIMRKGRTNVRNNPNRGTYPAVELMSSLSIALLGVARGEIINRRKAHSNNVRAIHNGARKVTA